MQNINNIHMSTNDFIDSIHDAAENFKKCYAKRLRLLDYNHELLSELSDISYYKIGIIGDIYVCFIEHKDPSIITKVPYITSDINDSSLAENSIKYIIRLKDKRVEWKVFVLQYLRMIAYSFTSAWDLITNTKVPMDQYLQNHVKNAYKTHESIIQLSLSGESILMEIDM
jgi:hypothetical protein